MITAFVNTLAARDCAGARTRRPARTLPARPLSCFCAAILIFACLGAFPARAATNSIARVWDDEILAAIRIDKPNPPVHARNLFSLSAAMYDAWAAYDPVAVGYVYRGKQTVASVAEARREAISYAAYRVLRERYALSRSAAKTLPVLDARMAGLGYDTNNVSTDPATPAGLGNAVYAAVHDWFINDGSYQTNSYKDLPPAQGGYAPVNDYMVAALGGVIVTDVNRWQPMSIANAIDQNGLPAGGLQSFLGSQWLWVRPFSLQRVNTSRSWIDPGPPPRLGGPGSEAFRSNVVEVIRRGSQLTPDDGVTIDISPGALGNNSLGANDGSGRALNPVTGSPYAPNVVKQGDFARVLTEFFADGPNSETPPGHWNTIANGVADDPTFVRRIGGAGPVLDELEWDVKIYFALNSALHDAACAAWALKRQYDGWRPMTAIRYMGQLGQSSDPGLPAYHTNGLPLIPGLIELVTPATTAAGARHAGLPVNQLAILAWGGPPEDPTNQHSGVLWMQPADWVPYQKATFVTPAFPGYISGHSTFSRAAAEVLAEVTGSAFFPGGMGTFTASAGKDLTTESGPSQTVQLQWATFFDAADMAGISRLWGGIHPPVDDFTGRRTGARVGQAAWALARQYFDGSIARAQAGLAFQVSDSSTGRILCDTVRGLYYKLQSTPDLSQPFTDEPGGFMQAFDSPIIQTNSLAGPARFYRMVGALTR